MTAVWCMAIAEYAVGTVTINVTKHTGFLKVLQGFGESDRHRQKGRVSTPTLHAR